MSTFRVKVSNGKNINLDQVNHKKLRSPPNFDRYDVKLGEINRPYCFYRDDDCLYVTRDGNHPDDASLVAEITVKGKNCCYLDKSGKETFSDNGQFEKEFLNGDVSWQLL